MSVTGFFRQLLTRAGDPLLAFAEFPVMLRIATIALLLGAIANPQVSRLDLSAVADGDTVFYYGTVGKFEIRLTLIRGGGDSASGSYQYATQNTELYLQSHGLPNGKLKIIESSAPNVATGEFVLEGSLELDQLDGTWRSADGRRSYPVHLGKIFEEQYDELPKIWKGRPKSAAAKVPPEPPGPVLRKRQQIETPIPLRGPNGTTLLASIQEDEDGATMRIWRSIDGGFQLLYETNSNSGTSVATYDVEAFRLSGEYFVHLMLLDSGTGYFHTDTFLWIAPDVTLQRVRFVEPAKAYRGLGKGEGVWKGEVNQFRDDDATFRFGVWREGDANGDPTGGQVKGHYKLTGGKQYHSETKQWSQDFQIVPADFARFAPEHQ